MTGSADSTGEVWSVKSKRNGCAGRPSSLNSGAGPQLRHAYRIAVIAGVIWLAVLFAAAQLTLGKSGSERGEDAAVIVDAAAATAE